MLFGDAFTLPVDSKNPINTIPGELFFKKQEIVI